MKLHDARRGARFSPQGVPVPLPEQDRSRWDQQVITSAHSLLEHALSQHDMGPFQIDAAISAVHCRALSPVQTDWREIAALYQLLERFRTSPAVRVNRAFAVGQAEGGNSGLALLDDVTDVDTSRYPYVHLVRGALLEDLGRTAEARDAYILARHHSRNRAEQTQIDSRLARLGARTPE